MDLYTVVAIGWYEKPDFIFNQRIFLCVIFEPAYRNNGTFSEPVDKDWIKIICNQKRIDWAP